MKFFSIFLILIIPFNVHATICQHLLGKWQGQWQIQDKVLNAKIIINYYYKDTYKGKFYLANNSQGSLEINCLPLAEEEAYLVLRADPPYFNPCRGTILFYQQQYRTHFFCFQPNEAGYFIHFGANPSAASFNF